jgi:hypothetical protein
MPVVITDLTKQNLVLFYFVDSENIALGIKIKKASQYCKIFKNDDSSIENVTSGNT